MLLVVLLFVFCLFYFVLSWPIFLICLHMPNIQFWFKLQRLVHGGKQTSVPLTSKDDHSSGAILPRASFQGRVNSEV